MKTLTTALAMVRQKRVAPRTRVTGKKQAVPAVPADLSQAIESLHDALHQDLLLALHHVQNITNVLRLYADVHPQVLETRDSVFRLLFDPTRVPQHGEPPVIAVMRMLLRPLWVRRQNLEKDYGPTARFPQRLEDHVLGEVWNKWQKAWYKCGEAIGCGENKKRRNAWFAMLKQRCGGAVWAKLLVQYGPGEMANLLGAVLDARENRETAQAPIMPAARATMRQHGAG